MWYLAPVEYGAEFAFAHVDAQALRWPLPSLLYSPNATTADVAHFAAQLNGGGFQLAPPTALVHVLFDDDGVVGVRFLFLVCWLALPNKRHQHGRVVWVLRAVTCFTFCLGSSGSWPELCHQQTNRCGTTYVGTCIIIAHYAHAWQRFPRRQ